MSIVYHPLWQQIKPYILVDEHERGYRIELKGAPPDIRALACAMYSPCVACGALMHPFRHRKVKNKDKRTNASGIYFGAACPQEERIGCCKGKKAKEEYLRVRVECGRRREAA